MTLSALPSYRAVGSVLRRTRVAAWWGALLAVRSKVRLSEYLAERVGSYRRRLLAQGIRLPVEVVLDRGRIRFRPIEEEEPTPPSGPEGIEASLAKAEGPEAVALLHEAERQALQQRERLEAARDAVTLRRRELTEALADGSAASLGARDRLPLPRIPGLLGPVLCFAVATVLVLAEAWQAAVPILDMTGIDTTDLITEARRSPVAVVLGFAFAAGATGVLVYFAHLAARRLSASVDDTRARRARLVDGVVAAALVLLIATFAWGLASMRHATSRAGAELAAAMAGGAAGDTHLWTFFLLVALLPFFGSALFHRGNAGLARRAAAREEAHRVQQAFQVRLEKRERLQEAVATAEQERLTLETEHASAQQMAVALRARGATAEREALRLERQDGERHAAAREDLAAVLEADRYAFVRRASARGLRGLIDDEMSVLGRARETPPPLPGRALSAGAA